MDKAAHSPVLPRPPLLTGLPRGAWTALTWCAAAVFPGALLLSCLLERGGLGVPAHQVLVLLAAVTTLPLGLLRRAPVLTLAVLLAGAAAGGLALHLTHILYLQFLSVDIALCYVAATRPRRISIAAAVVALGVALACYAPVRVRLWSFANGHAAGTLDAKSLIVIALTVLLAWLAGHSVRQRRDYAEMLHAQATVQAVTAERLRIARELHDVVAHSIGIIAIQAGVGSRVMDTQPAEARNTLIAIETTSREALSGLRRMLGALRQAERDSESGPAPLGPAPGLADLDRLAATAADAGVLVDVHWQGQRRLLPAEVDLSAFRIIQEAVTNVVRHAGTPRCRVSVAYGPQDLAIEVSDDGRGGSIAATGYGIAGMRERACLLQGDLSAGPRPGGGFRVAARLPAPAGAR